MVAGRLGAKLRELRWDRGIAQRQLADSVGVDSSLVSRVERGRDAQLSTWLRLAYGLGYEFDFRFKNVVGARADIMAEEAYDRAERQREGLCTGKRRF